ncbi:MAG: DUF5106 domain-containing protein [Flavihumibacter sp.]
MKNRFLCMVLACFACLAAIAQPRPAGHQLTVTVNAYEGQWLYLGYYYGKIRALADSVPVQKGTAVFKGNQPLPGGIYFVVSPKKEILFELLLDKQQHFSMKADSAHPEAVLFTGSADNTGFQAYTRFVQQKGNAIQQAQKGLGARGADTAALQQVIRQNNQAIQGYRAQVMQSQPGSLLSALFAALSEPTVPPAAAHPGGKYDSTYAYRYFKAHYWDGISLADDRLLRTPFFETRVDKYFKDLVSPAPDSIIREVDIFLASAQPNKETYKWLLTHFVQAYINPTYMGQDAVFVHLFEKYINGHAEVDWFTEKYQQYMSDRAYSLMANLIGNPAWELTMTDTSGKPATLYEIRAPYTVICFWDPTCSHCKEMVPRLDSMFQAKWKAMGIRLLGVMTDGGKENWLKYISEHNLAGWDHMYQSEAQHEAEKNSGRAGYRQLYDVYQTPVLYLLDNEKRIVAKKLTYRQIDDLITLKQTQPK